MEKSILILADKNYKYVGQLYSFLEGMDFYAGWLHDQRVSVQIGYEWDWKAVEAGDMEVSAVVIGTKFPNAAELARIAHAKGIPGVFFIEEDHEPGVYPKLPLPSGWTMIDRCACCVATGFDRPTGTSLDQIQQKMRSRRV